MSDDLTAGLAPGAVSLEDGPPMAPPEPKAEEKPAESAADDDAEPESIQVSIQGEKMVPLKALQEVRTQLKAAKAIAAQIDDLKAKAERGENIERNLAQVQPLLAKLQSRQDIIDHLTSGKPLPAEREAPKPPVDESGLSDDDAADLAKTLELYTPAGELDTGRARKIAAKLGGTATKRAEERAQAILAPVQQRLAQSTTEELQTRYSGMKDKAGRTVNPGVLKQMFSIVPQELIAQDPSVAGVLYYAAKGYAAHHGMDEPEAPKNLPIVTESPGGERGKPGPLSDLERRIARAMGDDTGERFKKSASGYKPGSINILE